MKNEKIVILMSVMFLLGCSAREELNINKVTVSPQVGFKQYPVPFTHYIVDKSELIDRTVSEEHFENPSYGEGNGTVLSYSEYSGKKVWKRKFIEEIDVKTYEFAEKQFLFIDPNEKNTVCAFSNNTRLKSTQMLITKSEDGKSIECWINVFDISGHQGWVYVGSRDPYSNDNWTIIGSVEVDGEKLLLRKYTHMFSIWRTQAAYNEPSTSGTILWHPLRTDDNSQINLEAICVTDKTYQGEYFPEHWVKVKDSYGRIGWFPGDKLEIERGGFKYLTPENIVKYAFFEP